jgi:hypothetical protein
MLIIDIIVVWLQGCLSTWVEKEATQVVLQHLMLGFELDVYAPHEFTYLYW